MFEWSFSPGMVAITRRAYRHRRKAKDGAKAIPSSIIRLLLRTFRAMGGTE
jgi:hypothetical protein